MALIYSSFADSLNQPLDGLVGEFTKLLSYLNSKEIKKRVDFQAAYGMSVNELTTDLIRHQKDLRLFHFSGHSSNDGLDLPEADFETAHFSNFFNTLNSEKQLECVLLNGCSNAALVKKLSNVPVVIGSTSPILNKDAIKFTNDFFGALIGGNVSYELAFKQATDALTETTDQTDIIRGGGALATRQSFNKYFMVINDQEVAGRKFPVKTSNSRRILSWVIYLAILLTIGAGAWFYLHRDEIKEVATGLNCPEWEDTKKCNVLVADFNDPDANQFISDGINKSAGLSEYLSARYRHSLNEDVIRDESIQSHELPERCKFDYLLTGAVNDARKLITIELIPQILAESNEAEYRIVDLYDFRKTIKDIKDIDQDTLILSQICVACATKDKLPPKLAEAQIQKLKNKPGAENIFQDQNETMAYYYLQKTDTTSAIHSLEEIASIDINDKSLAALEAKSELQLASRQFSMAYQTQSRYIQSVDDRLNAPSRYKMSAPEDDYQTAYQDARLARARLVLKQPDKLAFANEQALEDFKFLERTRYKSRRYTTEIKTIQDRLSLPPEPPTDPKPIQLIVRTDKGRGIRTAVAVYNNQTYQADRNGFISIPCPNDNCLRRWCRIKAEGFDNKDINLQRLTNGMNITLNRTVVAPRYTAKGKVVDRNNRPIAGVQVAYSRKQVQVMTETNGLYDLNDHMGDAVLTDLIVFSRQGFQTQRKSIRDLQQNSTIKMTPSATLEKEYTFSGNIRDCNYRNTALKRILINGKTAKIDQRSNYSFSLMAKPGDKIKITLPTTALRFEKSESATFTLTDRTEIKTNFKVLENKPTNYTINGQVTSNGGAVMSTTIVLVGSASGAVTDFEGRFQLRTNGYFCQKIQVTAGSVNKLVELRNYTPDANGNIRVNINL